MSNIENLISKVISGNASLTEIETLNCWINSSIENKNIFESKKLTWNLIGSSKKIVEPNIENAWERFNTLKSTTKIEKKSGFIYKIAALFIVVLSSSLLLLFLNKSDVKQQYAQITPKFLDSNFLNVNVDLFNNDDIFDNNVIVSNKKTKKKEFLISNEIVPKDSSSVDLYPHSILSFLDNTPNQPRIASLSGAGMFNIKPLDKEFILETENLKIKVQGTKFNIQTPTENKKYVEISVEEGNMEVYEKSNPSNKIHITSNQKYIFNLETHEFVKIQVAKKAPSKWKMMMNKIFKKNNTNI